VLLRAKFISVRNSIVVDRPTEAREYAVMPVSEEHSLGADDTYLSMVFDEIDATIFRLAQKRFFLPRPVRPQ
jgi:hypothetical protein